MAQNYKYTHLLWRLLSFFTSQHQSVPPS